MVYSVLARFIEKLRILSCGVTIGLHNDMSQVGKKISQELNCYILKKILEIKFWFLINEVTMTKIYSIFFMSLCSPIVTPHDSILSFSINLAKTE